MSHSSKDSMLKTNNGIFLEISYILSLKFFNMYLLCVRGMNTGRGLRTACGSHFHILRSHLGWESIF